MLLRDWTVDYGHGPIPCTVPHAWTQDVPVAWEGPAVYRCLVDLEGPTWLYFHGVAFQAKVFMGDVLLAVHEGIWDAFVVPIDGQGSHEIRVEVVKNGGSTFPVREVASGFIPFVYHTFGGIYKPVELLKAPPALSREPVECRYVVEGKGLRLKGGRVAQSASFKSQAEEWLAKRSGQEAMPATSTGCDTLFLRGILSWGWYPELGHMNPPDETIRREVDQARSLGFNMIKFCLWVPPHRYLEIMEESGVHAWIELPLWDPIDGGDAQEQILAEFERIVKQYRHHPNIALWTCGCELHGSTSAAYRKRLYDLVKELSGGLVKDNSGSAEMYGGDLREYGDFYDFHPYCDAQFFPPVLDSLLVGPRRQMPVFLGEFNDFDVHRDLPRLRNEAPFWTSPDADLNDQGVRWQHDLPQFLPDNRFAIAPDEHRHAALMACSRGKALFVRKYVQEAVRARDDIAGYVLTGWRDTPISTSGVVDDWNQLRFKPEELGNWNRETCLFLIPSRRPPWVNGGNRPGWIDPFNWFEGRAFWKVGIHSENGIEGALEWDLLHFSWQGNRRPKGRVAQGRGKEMRVDPLASTEVGEISWDTDEPGGYLLRVQFGEFSNTWPFWVVPQIQEMPNFAIVDGVQTCGSVILLDGDGTFPAPFWRECAFEFENTAFWEAVGYREAWERLLPISTDCVIDQSWVKQRWPDRDWEVLLNRIDVRTYREAPILMAGRNKHSRMFVTTLRPEGGLGNCPVGLSKNPSGANFVARLFDLSVE